MAYTFDKANADAPSTHKTQYFEMFGNRAHLPRRLDRLDRALSGAVERHRAAPKDIVNGIKWELFDLTKDWTQNNDVAAANPEKLKELQDLFWVEAAEISGAAARRLGVDAIHPAAPEHRRRRNEFTYTKPIVGVPLGTAPSILNKSSPSPPMSTCRMAAATACSSPQGGRFGGWGFYLLKGKPVFVYDLLDLARPRVEAALASRPASMKSSSPSSPMAGPRQGRNRHDHGRWYRGGERNVSPHHTLCP